MKFEERFVPQIEADEYHGVLYQGKTLFHNAIS